MRCSRARRIAMRRMDGEHVGWRGRLLDRHLVGCAPCRRWIEAQSRIGETLAGALPVPPASGDWPAILARIQTARAGYRSLAERLLALWTWRPGPAAMAVTGVLMVVIGAAAGVFVGNAIQAWRHPARCEALSGTLGDLPAGSPGHGMAELIARHLGAAQHWSER